MQRYGGLAVGAIDIGKHLVSLALLFTVAVLDTKFKELLQIFNSVVVIVWGNFLLNQSNLLVAFSFLVFVVGTLCYIETLLEEGKSQVKFGFLTILNGDKLINAHQVT